MTNKKKMGINILYISNTRFNYIELCKVNIFFYISSDTRLNAFSEITKKFLNDDFFLHTNNIR